MDPEALRHPVLPLGRIALRTLVSRILEGVLSGAGTMIGAWELRVTTDPPMAGLHAFHLGGAGPTNVLAFPAPMAGQGTEDYGSIALNADAVMREACLYGQDPTEHLIRLLTHAVLHLAGFDHGHAMEELTEAVVQDLGDQEGRPSVGGIAKEES